VNAYKWVDGRFGEDVWTFPRLIREINQLDGLLRIFYTSSHPIDVTPDMIDVHATCEKLMPFLHLPVQSGSNRVLDAMNRRHSVEEYKCIIDTVRARVSNIALSSDFIVGFPGETDDDFEATLDLVRYVKYAQAYSFKYSPRPNTAASKMPNQVPEDVKSARLQILQDLLRQQQIEFNRKCVGRTLSVRFHKGGKKPLQVIGRSEYMQSVVVNIGSPGEVHEASAIEDEFGAMPLTNTVRRVRIKNATLSSLEGEL
jgi:tRNA-2-methylthio-N6-dimethylallyladenosine synthase